MRLRITVTSGGNNLPFSSNKDGNTNKVVATVAREKTGHIDGTFGLSDRVLNSHFLVYQD